MSRCCWCGRESDDLVERPNADDHGPIGLWCEDWNACQAAKAAREAAGGGARSAPRRRIASP